MEAVAQRSSSQQHPEPHCLAVGERNFCRKGRAADLDLCLDDETSLTVPARICDDALIKDIGMADSLDTRVVLQRTDPEAHSLYPILDQRLDKERMQRRGARPSVHLAFDVINI